MLIPGLFGVRSPDTPGPVADTVRVDVLARMLARADVMAVDDDGLETALFRLFGIASSHAPDLPVAPLTLLFDAGAPVSGYWLRADPVHLRAGHDKVVMSGDALLQISPDEAAALCAEINDHLAGLGIRLIAPVGERWYLSLPRPPAVRFSPFSAVRGRDVRPHMPQGEAAREWRRLLNEIQMLLHASEVNRRRSTQGRVEINSVWFWGGGVLPAAGACRFAQVWGRHPLAGGLALHAGRALLPLPADAPGWLAAAGAGRHLAVLDLLDQAVTPGDVEGWCGGMRVLHERWIEPMWPMLRGGRLGALTICSAAALDYHITPKLMRRWWRRTKPFAAFG